MELLDFYSRSGKVEVQFANCVKNLWYTVTKMYCMYNIIKQNFNKWNILSVYSFIRTRNYCKDLRDVDS